MSTEPSQMRADARENRSRVLEVARELFAQRGTDVPMAAIARRAGVGVATLYRRFPTRESLILEAFAEQFEVCLRATEEALEDPDPWRGLCTVIEEVCAMQAADRGFTAAIIAEFGDLHAEARDRTFAGFERLVQRAKDSGQLREDFSPHDLTLVLMANSGLVGVPDAAAASKRLVAYLLEAFRVGTGVLPPPVPLSLELVRLKT